MAEPLTGARDRFERLCAEQPQPPLDEVTALIAAEENPTVDPDGLVQQLDELAKGLWIPPGIEVAEQVARLNHHLFQTLGFRGDREDYGAVEHSLLDRVLDQRVGLPILLCVVAMELARRVDLILEGVGFPGHFLLAPAEADPRFFIDPFNGGRILTRDVLLQRLQTMSGGQAVANPDRYLREVPNRFIAVRICNNLKGAFLRSDDIEGALRAVERLLILDPDLREEQRDRGMILHHLGRDAEAAEQLKAYLEGWPDAPDRERIEALLEEL